MSLTKQQIEILKVLKAVAPDSLTGPQLVEALNGVTDQKPEGIHQTATGLSRRGLVLKAWTGSITRSVSYAIAPPGERALKQQLIPRSRIRRSKT